MENVTFVASFQGYRQVRLKLVCSAIKLKKLYSFSDKEASSIREQQRGRSGGKDAEFPVR